MLGGRQKADRKKVESNAGPFSWGAIVWSQQTGKESPQATDFSTRIIKHQCSGRKWALFEVHCLQKTVEPPVILPLPPSSSAYLGWLRCLSTLTFT